MNKRTINQVAQKFLELRTMLIGRCTLGASVISEELDDEIEADFLEDLVSGGCDPDFEKAAAAAMGREYFRLREWIRSAWEDMMDCCHAFDAEAKSAHLSLSPSKADDGFSTLLRYSVATNHVGYPEGFTTWLEIENLTTA